MQESRTVVRVTGGFHDDLVSRTLYVVPRRPLLDSVASACLVTRQAMRDSFGSPERSRSSSDPRLNKLRALIYARLERELLRGLHDKWGSAVVSLATQRSEVSPAGYSDSLVMPDDHSVFVIIDSLSTEEQRVANPTRTENHDLDASLVLTLDSTGFGSSLVGFKCPPPIYSPDNPFAPRPGR